MIVKQRPSFKWSSGTLFGFAGGVFGVITIGLMIKSQLAPETYPACSERYAQAGMFSLERPAGGPLSAAELQSRLAGREWGVLHNVFINPDDSTDGNLALTVNFLQGGKVDPARRRSASGVSFNWQPGFLKQASAACLSYSVHLPAKFEFAGGGTLPGLRGGSQTPTPGGKAPFSSRMRWLNGGRVGVQSVTSTNPAGGLIVLAEKSLKLPRDQWVKMEQEVVLNTPGKNNGVLRIWINGKLRLNSHGIAFRKDASSGFAGVIADTHYANRAMKWLPAPKATKIKLSPMIVRWN